jgi:hypothetical protein
VIADVPWSTLRSSITLPLASTFTHQPRYHCPHYQNKMLSVKNGLPKFKDLPAEFGGSGETLPE